MGGGSGGSSAPTEQTVYSESLPPYVEPYFKRLLQRTEGESLQDYTPYGGQRLAYFSPDERKAQAMTRGYAQAGTPQEFGQAQQMLTGLSQPYTAGYQAGTGPQTYQAGQLGSSQYAAGQFDAGYDPSMRASGYTATAPTEQYQPLGFEQNLQRFMSPYQQNVVDIQKREARRQSDITGEQIGSQAAQAGGLGGYREAILQAERERNLGQQLGDIQARGSQQAYQQAVQQIGAERAADLQAAQFGLQQYGLGEQAAQRQEQLGQQAFAFGEQAKQQAAKLGLTAQQQEEAARQAQEKFRQTGFQADQQALQAQGQQALAGFQAQEAARQAQERFGQSAYDLSQRYGQSAAQQLAGLGQARQADVQQRIAALTGIGSQQRALRQAGLDLGYEDFLRQQQYPQQQLGFYSNILRGVPVQPQRTVSTYTQQPGLFQQTLGLGLSGLGLYKGLQG
tara:strand:+ start:2411 stop:3763 length:1353 start_codon:yes stop_codon:yes gene_type:complete